MLHLYAVTEHPATLTDARGIDDATLGTATSDGLDAVVSRVDTAAPATEAAILAHARVVERLAEANAAVLPARFQQAYPDEESVVRALLDRNEQLRAGLERVRGCAEIGVRVVRGSGRENDTAASGAEYMRGRLAAVHEAEELALQLKTAVGAAARAGVDNVLATPELVLSAAFLVARDEVDAVRDAVDGIARDRPELSFVCTGPWPPYSFALVEGGTE
jgi:hypothetical protein